MKLGMLVVMGTSTTPKAAKAVYSVNIASAQAETREILV